MKSMHVDIFFSCSFSPDDKPVNDLFYAICRALDVRASNVATAFAVTPPEGAKKFISQTQALIAICTRRHQLADGQHMMPDAVHEELSFAFGKDIPVLMFVEDDVQISGFQDNFATHLRFDRSQLYTLEVIEKISILRQSRRFYDCWPLKGA